MSLKIDEKSTHAMSMDVELGDLIHALRPNVGQKKIATLLTRAHTELVDEMIPLIRQTDGKTLMVQKYDTCKMLLKILIRLVKEEL